MSYSISIDESTFNGLNYAAGVLDVRDSFYDTTSAFGRLREGYWAYGELTVANGPSYLLRDHDFYDLGFLSSGVYQISVENFTWDFGNFDPGSVSSFSLISSSGLVLETSYSVFSPIQFTASGSSQYFVSVTGPISLDAQYRIGYSFIVPAPTNSPAVFGTGFYYGDVRVHADVSASISYFDANGNSDNLVVVGWYVDGVFQDVTLVTDSFSLLGEHQGKALSFLFMFIDDAGNTEISPLFSAGIVQPNNRAPTGAVTISGTAREGSTLTAVTSTIADPDGLGSFSYRWFAGGTAISGATASTFTPGQAQLGQVISVRVSYTDGQGATESLNSTATAAVQIGANIQRSTSFSLPDNGYTIGLTLTGLANINGTGNGLNNRLTGNSGNNRLDGGVGADTLLGGAGSDTYLVDNLGDRVFETTATTSSVNAGGTDTVLSSVTFNLNAYAGVRFVEKLTLTGNANINGTGNMLANVMTGNSGNNRLDGGAGNDTLLGGAGHDTLRGDVGNDILQGDAGRDILTGGLGNDRFVFRSVSESATGTSTADVITDFLRGQDRIDLSTIDAFAGTSRNDAFVWRGTGAFTSSTQGEVRYQQFNNAGTSNDYTMIWIDNDRDTGVEMAIRLTGLHNLNAADFIL